MTEVLNRETGELTEQPDEEAQIVAEMTPETEAEPEPEPEDEPEPEPDTPEPLPQSTGPAPNDVEQRFQKLDTSTLTYTRRVAELLDWMVGELELCPLCSPTPHLGFVNMGAAGLVPSNVIDVVQAYLGFAREIEYRQDPEVQTCQRCQGEGKTQTGSKVKGNETRRCPACRGYGYQPPPRDDAEGAPIAAPIHAPEGEQVAPVNTENRDPWGDAKTLPDGRENPNYGKMPQFKVQIQPWGTTANLTAQDA